MTGVQLGEDNERQTDAIGLLDDPDHARIALAQIGVTVADHRPKPREIKMKPSPSACLSALVKAVSLLQVDQEPSAEGTTASHTAPAIERAMAVLSFEYPEVALEQLLEADGWAHPCEVLGQPRPSCGVLLRLCKKRIPRSRGPKRSRLVAMRERLERIVEIERNARRRRHGSNREFAAFIAECQRRES